MFTTTSPLKWVVLPKVSGACLEFCNSEEDDGLAGYGTLLPMYCNY